MPINSEHLASLTDADVIDQNGDKVGRVGQIYLDDATGQPAWVSVKSGLFGLRESFVPLNHANVADGNIQVPYTKDHVKDAPRIDAEDHLDDSQQSTLFSHYGVERGAAAGAPDSAGAPDRTAAFGSDETAEDMSRSRTEGIATAGQESDEVRDGAVTTEYTTPGVDDVTAGAGVGDGGNDLGSGSLTDPVPASSGGADVSDVGDSAADAGASDDGRADDRDQERDQEWDRNHEPGEEQSGVFQQGPPAGDADWSAEQAPSAPTSQPWAMPTSDPADEEPTDASRSGYASDQPAAHSAAYEGRGDGVDTATNSGQFGTVEPVTTGSAPDVGSTTGDYGEFERIEDGTEAAADETAVDESAVDETAVSGSDSATGTGYPQDDAGDSGAIGVPGVAVAAGGAAAVGYAADTSTTAYETPGAETGDPITGSTPGAAFASDVEQPADGLTLPDDTASDSEFVAQEETLAAGTDAGVGDTGEPDDTREPEVFGPEGYRPDRDGTEMSDEERERLNRARGAL